MKLTPLPFICGLVLLIGNPLGAFAQPYHCSFWASEGAKVLPDKVSVHLSADYFIFDSFGSKDPVYRESQDGTYEWKLDSNEFHVFIQVREDDQLIAEAQGSIGGRVELFLSEADARMRCDAI